MVEVPTINVFLLIDNELLRLAIRQVLTESDFCNLVGEAADSHTLLDLFSDGGVDVVLANRSALKTDVAEWVTQVKAQSHAHVLIALENAGDFPTLAASGVDGFLLQNSPSFLLPIAVKVVHEGGCWIGPGISRYLLKEDGRRFWTSSLTGGPISADVLTAKEKQVMALLNEGLTNPQIAGELGLSVETVRVHVKHIFRKLGARDRFEATQKISGQFARPPGL